MGRSARICSSWLGSQGIAGKVRFRGRQSRRQVADAMRRATVFALPSRYEGLGCVYLEAMSAGKPVIACRGQGIDEVIEQGVNGCLVGAGDLQELTDTLARILRQAELRRSMGGRPRAHDHPAGIHPGHQAARLVPALSGVPGMRRRLVILSEIIAPYRIPVFNALAQHEEIDLHVIFLAESDPKLREWLVYKDEIRFSYQVLPSWRCKFAGHNLLLNRGLKRDCSALPRTPSCAGVTIIWPRGRPCGGRAQRRIPFILWVESTERDIRSRNRVIEFLKRKFMRRAAHSSYPGSLRCSTL